MALVSQASAPRPATWLVAALAIPALGGLIRPQHALAGPERGTLVAAGGGRRIEPIFRRFVELAGGIDARIVIVPTAASTEPDYDYDGHRHVRLAREVLAPDRLTVVHTHDREEADSERFVTPIREADGVWFTGGRQWRLVDAYASTLAETEFRRVLERGGVIGGSSAGATIQGSFLVRGDTSGSDVLIGDHQHGFGFLRNCAIDQHVVPRGRQQGLIEVLTDPEGKLTAGIDRAELLGLGLDENTAIVVRADQFEVIGEPGGVVLVYDPRSWADDTPDREKYQQLGIGARYDLARRAVIEPDPRQPAKQRPEGFHADLFVSGGVNLSSRKRMPAAESLGLYYELYAGRDKDRQNALIAGREDDHNGVLLYPDGEPRFRMVYVHGGSATRHGKSLGEAGRAAMRRFVENGGSYCGSCAGSFLVGRNTDAKTEPRLGYLHLFPYNTRNTGIKKGRVGHAIPDASPLLAYHDFGDDRYVADIYHNNGNWLSLEDLASFAGVVPLAFYDAPGRQPHRGAAIWAFKQDVASGRVVNIGSHPENIKEGERLALTEACFLYALDGVGEPTVKARLRPGVVRRMDKDTSDGQQAFCKIGDRQYHHFSIAVGLEPRDVRIELDGEPGFDLNLYLRRGAPAFRSNAELSAASPGPREVLEARLAPGEWFVGVECATTVEAVLAESGECYVYSGPTAVLDGVAYEIVWR